MFTINILLLVISPVLGVCLAAVLLKRRLVLEFPFFFSYIIASIIGEIIGLAVVRNYVIYYYVFWTFEVVYAILALAALYEAFYGVFRSFFHKYAWFWLLFPSAVLLVVAFAALYAIQRPPTQAARITSLILSLEIGINLIQSCLFLLLQGAMWFFRARRRNYPLGIVDGFAIVALAGLLYALRSEFGTKFTLLVQYGVPVAYILAEIVWLAAFLRPPEPAPQLPRGITLEQALDEMTRDTEWVKDLSRKLRR